MEKKTWVTNWGNLSPKRGKESCTWFWFHIWENRGHCKYA